MAEQMSGAGQPKRKGWFARLVEKLDKKLQDKSQQQPCCAKPGDKPKSKCC